MKGIQSWRLVALNRSLRTLNSLIQLTWIIKKQIGCAESKGLNLINLNRVGTRRSQDILDTDLNPAVQFLKIQSHRAVNPSHLGYWHYWAKVRGHAMDQPSGQILQNLFPIYYVHSKVTFSIHVMKTYRNSEGIVPLNRNLCARWRWAVSHAPRPDFTQRKNLWYQMDPKQHRAFL
jgi:hypothetical protein